MPFSIKRAFSQRRDRRLELVKKLGLATRKLPLSQRKYIRRKMAEVKINERLKTPAEEEAARVRAIQESGRRQEDALTARNARLGAVEGGPGKDYWRAYHSRNYNALWDGYLGKELGKNMVAKRGLYRQYFAGLPKAGIKKLIVMRNARNQGFESSGTRHKRAVVIGILQRQVVFDWIYFLFEPAGKSYEQKPIFLFRI